MTGQAAGQGNLEVRFSNDHSVTHSVPYVGIGDVYVVAGQSNAEGRGDLQQTSTHPTLKASVFRQDNQWYECNDPTDIGTVIGSPWPLLATKIMLSEHVPVAFITTAEGNTGLSSPPDWSPGGSAYQSMIQTVQSSGVSDAICILWHQGETDANNGVSSSAYESILLNMLGSARIDLSMPSLKLVCANLGYKTTGNVTRNHLDAIRIGQVNACEHSTEILYGPVLYDIGPFSDGVHFKTNLELNALANLWWRMLHYHFYGGQDGLPASLIMATYIGDTITLLFDRNLTDSIIGWRITSNGQLVNVVSVTVDLGEVTIICDSQLSEPVKISFGSFNEAIQTGLLDTGTPPMPPLPLVDVEVAEQCVNQVKIDRICGTIKGTITLADGTEQPFTGEFDGTNDL